MTEEDLTGASPEGDRSDLGRARTCFVIGPIGNRLAPHESIERETYESSLRVMAEIIEPACQRLGLDPVRADALGIAGEINEQIFRRLRDDDVVIADLTGANANVMYELGLRHSKDKLTVQIGEYGQLPFDIATIRTIRFSSSAIGRIDARDELVQVLEAGLEGEFDPVSATRIWNDGDGGDGSLAPLPPDDSAPGGGSVLGEPAVSNTEDESGFLDIMVEAEERQDGFADLLAAVNEKIVALGDLAEAGAEEIGRSDAAGSGMRGRLQIATKQAHGTDKIATELEKDVDNYVEALKSISAGNLLMISSIEEDPEQLKDPEVDEFATVVRGLAATTRTSLSALAGLSAAIDENAKLSRVLREPSQRVTAALARFVDATAVIDEWDRRLQALGVVAPPEGWEIDGESDDV